MFLSLRPQSQCLSTRSCPPNCLLSISAFELGVGGVLPYITISYCSETRLPRSLFLTSSSTSTLLPFALNHNVIGVLVQWLSDAHLCYHGRRSASCLRVPNRCRLRSSLPSSIVAAIPQGEGGRVSEVKDEAGTRVGMGMAGAMPIGAMWVIVIATILIKPKRKSGTSLTVHAKSNED